MFDFNVLERVTILLGTGFRYQQDDLTMNMLKI